MSGPLTSFIFLLLSTSLFPSKPLEAKSLSARSAGRSLDLNGGVRRFRRELRDSLPYEAQMMSYPQTADMKRRGNDLYYQPEEWRGQGLGQALQQLVESDQRRNKEASYLAGLLRLLNEGDGPSQGGGKGGEDTEEDGGDFQGPYPPDYDETDQGISMAKPQASWQGLVDPQLTQALLDRYRQERLLQAGMPAMANRIQESRVDPGAQEKDQEVLRYLVTEILSSMAPGSPQAPSGRRSRRDLGSVSGGGRAADASKRTRRSLDPGPSPSAAYEPSLLRVKRLEEEEEAEGGAMGAESHRTPHPGLQRMKRIDTEVLPGKRGRKRRAVTYDPSKLARYILQHLPE